MSVSIKLSCMPHGAGLGLPFLPPGESWPSVNNAAYPTWLSQGQEREEKNAWALHSMEKP